MNIISLTDGYREVQSGTKSLEWYRQLAPALFHHYESYWGGDLNQIFSVSEDILLNNEKALRRELLHVETILKQERVDLSKIDVVLFVGNGVSTGHAFLFEERSVVWLPVETYGSLERIASLVPHEILHGAHYVSCPNIAISSVEEERNTLREFIVEGFATYFTARLFGLSDRQVLWGDAFSDDQFVLWVDRSDRIQLASLVLEDDDTIFFSSQKKPPGREGYLLALDWARTFFKEKDLRGALETTDQILITHALDWLKKQ